jgi:hypothetical protein
MKASFFFIVAFKSFFLFAQEKTEIFKTFPFGELFIFSGKEKGLEINSDTCDGMLWIDDSNLIITNNRLRSVYTLNGGELRLLFKEENDYNNYIQQYVNAVIIGPFSYMHPFRI